MDPGVLILRSCERPQIFGIPKFLARSHMATQGYGALRVSGLDRG